ncbi:MAG: TetR/AcrR family transcriptional regulator [Clostridia bacterium]|nr:TetR/AcrR family transcriptional regulator [Clostridia bacterium]
MNQKKNQRFQETDQRIRAYFIQALEEKEISKITVREICEAVGINRSSFYLHYPDVYALLEAMCNEVGKELFEDFGKLGEEVKVYFSEPYLLVILRHVQKHAVLYKAYIGHVGMAPIEKGYQILLEEVFKPYFRRLGIQSERRMEYHFYFVQHGFFSVLERWMHYGCAEPPEEMAQIILQTMAPIPTDLPVMDGL